MEKEKQTAESNEAAGRQKKIRNNVIFVVVITLSFVLFVVCMMQLFNQKVEAFKLSPQYQEFQERWAEQHDPGEPGSLLSIEMGGFVEPGNQFL